MLLYFERVGVGDCSSPSLTADIEDGERDCRRDGVAEGEGSDCSLLKRGLGL